VSSLSPHPTPSHPLAPSPSIQRSQATHPSSKALTGRLCPLLATICLETLCAHPQGRAQQALVRLWPALLATPQCGDGFQARAPAVKAESIAEQEILMTQRQCGARVVLRCLLLWVLLGSGSIFPRQLSRQA